MDHRRRTILASVGIVLMFLVVQVGALALIEPFQSAGHQVNEDTSDPTISIVYVGAIVIVTGLMLLAFKYGGKAVLRLLIIFSGAYMGLFVFQVLIPDIVSVTIDGTAVNALAWGSAFALGVALYAYPEWYVIDTAGVIMGIGAAGLFGINFGIFPAIVLLVILAVYDAISVYQTEHMLTLASGAMDMKVPVVLVVPVSLSYSFLDDGGPSHIGGEKDDQGESDDAIADETDTQTDDDSQELDEERLSELGPDGIEELEDDELEGLDPAVLSEVDDETADALRERLPDRQALFIGLGDAVIPTVLVASAAFFVPQGPEISFGVASATLPAVGAMGGILGGLVVLLWLVLKGRAHAGLPLLNGGAIAGYLVGALLSGLTLVEALGIEGFV
jgi:presenilin-like A22 family membrane protease